jgi:hypothetical protein
MPNSPAFSITALQCWYLALSSAKKTGLPLDFFQRAKKIHDCFRCDVIGIDATKMLTFFSFLTHYLKPREV